jgi:SAM-dependent methyltransferase
MRSDTDAHNPLRVFDPKAVRQHRERAAARRTAEFLFEESATRLVDRLADINRCFPRVLDLGCRDGLLGRHLHGRSGIEWLVAADPALAFVARAPSPRVVADAETQPFAPSAFDLVVSNLALHWTNDLPGALLQLRYALKPDGLLLASLCGGETLGDLRAALIAAESEIEGGASPRVSPFADARDLASLLQRDMGESNALTLRRRNFMRRATLLRAAEIYQARSARTDGRISARFEIVTLTAWAPHESQPKALRPGSAEARLADALGTREHSAGEKARR